MKELIKWFNLNNIKYVKTVDGQGTIHITISPYSPNGTCKTTFEFTRSGQYLGIIFTAETIIRI